jgi:hypothetical protein
MSRGSERGKKVATGEAEGQISDGVSFEKDGEEEK